MRPACFALLVALLGIGCSQRKLRTDDLDPKASRAALGCAPGLTGDRADACRMLDEFEAADTFGAWPAKGLETWYGRKICSDAIDATDRMDIARVHLTPGPGKTLVPSDVPIEPSRIVPHGAQFIAASIGSASPDVLKGQRLLVAAAATGTEPKLDTIADPADRDLVKRSWEDAKKPPGTKDYFQLVKSDGKSILGNPYTTDSPKGPSATYFVRGKADKMLLVWPSNDPKVPTCVGEAWRIYVAP